MCADSLPVPVYAFEWPSPGLAVLRKLRLVLLPHLLRRHTTGMRRWAQGADHRRALVRQRQRTAVPTGSSLLVGIVQVGH